MKIKGWLTKQFDRLKLKYVPAVGVAGSGAALVYGFANTGRWDLLAGGVLFGLLGAAVADNTARKNYCSRALSRVFNCAADKPVQQGTVLATLGMTAALVLGGGDFVQLMKTQGLAAGQLADWQTLKNVLTDPAIYKIGANIGPFAAASAIDYPWIYNRLANRVGERNTRILQTALSLVGSAMIGIFGLRARVPTARVSGLVMTPGKAVHIGIQASQKEGAAAAASTPERPVSQASAPADGPRPNL